MVVDIAIGSNRMRLYPGGMKNEEQSPGQITKRSRQAERRTYKSEWQLQLSVQRCLCKDHLVGILDVSEELE